MDKRTEGLQSYETLSGTPGQPGAKSRLKFKWENVIETITERNLPEEFSGTYESKFVFNIVKNKFVSLPSNMTKYITEQGFQFKGFMKIIAFLMPGAFFKKQSMKYLRDFKNFVENQNEFKN